MAPAVPEQERILELYAQGMSRNAISREIGRSSKLVSRVVNEAGGSFSRASTAKATEAKVLDAAAKRAALENLLLEDAAKLRDRLWKDCLVFNFGGKDNTYAEALLDEPTYTDKLKIIQSVSTAIQTSLRLSEHDAGTQRHSVNLIISTAEALGLDVVDGE